MSLRNPYLVLIILLNPPLPVLVALKVLRDILSFRHTLVHDKYSPARLLGVSKTQTEK